MGASRLMWASTACRDGCFCMLMLDYAIEYLYSLACPLLPTNQLCCVCCAPCMLQLRAADGVLVPGGFGNRGVEGKILAAQYARENKVPYLGICLGMQVNPPQAAGARAAASCVFSLPTAHGASQTGSKLFINRVGRAPAYLCIRLSKRAEHLLAHHNANSFLSSIHDNRGSAPRSSALCCCQCPGISRTVLYMSLMLTCCEHVPCKQSWHVLLLRPVALCRLP